MPFPLEWRDVFEIRPRPIVGAVSLGPGTDLDGRRDAQEVKKNDGDLCAVSAAQGAKLRVHRSDHPLGLRTFEWIRNQVQKEGVNIPLPTRN